MTPKEELLVDLIMMKANEKIDDPEVAKERISNHFHSINNISDRLKDNPEFFIDIIKTDGKINGYAIQYASDNVRNNPYVILEAVKKQKHIISSASLELQSIVGDNDPVETLTNYIKSLELTEKLNETLPNIEQSQTHKRKLKI